MEEEDLSFDELLQEVQQQFLCYSEKANKRFLEIESSIGLAAQKIETLLRRKTQGKKVNLKSSLAKTKAYSKKEQSKESLYHLKLKFPKFVEGSGVAEWIQDCEQYFLVYQVEDSKKVVIAGMHLEESAKKWFQIYAIEKKSLVWSEFCKQFTARFGVWEQELIYDNFKQLQPTSTVDLYFNQFEKYQEQLKEKMPFLTEDFFVECFVGGLQGRIRETLRLLAPSTVEQAYKQAKQKILSI